jgi:hypothetical protein
MAATLVAASGFGDADEWTWALTQAQSARGNGRTRGALTALVNLRGGPDRTAIVRTLLCGCDEMQRIRASGNVLAPARLLVSVGNAVATGLALQADAPDSAERDAAEAFIADVAARLAQQVAAALGPVYAAEFEDFLSRMSRFM